MSRATNGAWRGNLTDAERQQLDELDKELAAYDEKMMPLRVKRTRIQNRAHKRATRPPSKSELNRAEGEQHAE